jgi:hypothetical protein
LCLDTEYFFVALHCIFGEFKSTLSLAHRFQGADFILEMIVCSSGVPALLHDDRARGNGKKLVGKGQFVL